MSKQGPEKYAGCDYRPTSIVCPLDLQGDARGGLRVAAELASRIGATLHVLYVLDNPPPAPVTAGQRILPDITEHWETLRRRSRAELDKILEREVDELPDEVVREVVVGVRYHEIARYADDVDAELIVISARGRQGLSEHVLGSVAERVVRLGACPVLTVPPETETLDLDSILFATDLSDNSDQATPAARFLADVFGADVTLLHVLPTTSPPAMLPETGPAPTASIEHREERRSAAEEDLDARAKLFGEATSVTIELVASNDPGTAIIDTARSQGADVIVAGTHGLSGLTRLLLGSTAEKIVREADRAVLTVTPGFFEEADDVAESDIAEADAAEPGAAEARVAEKGVAQPAATTVAAGPS